METSLISVTEQLAIIHLAKQNLNDRGLCYTLNEAIIEIRNEYHHDYQYLKEYIPLFTHMNAVKYANANPDTYLYWWNFGEEGMANRMLFLDWMENELLS